MQECPARSIENKVVLTSTSPQPWLAVAPGRNFGQHVPSGSQATPHPKGSDSIHVPSFHLHIPTFGQCVHGRSWSCPLLLLAGHKTPLLRLWSCSGSEERLTSAACRHEQRDPEQPAVRSAPSLAPAPLSFAPRSDKPPLATMECPRTHTDRLSSLNRSVAISEYVRPKA